MEFRVLGPIEVWQGDQPVKLGGPKQRSLLGALLLRTNEVVSSDRLIEELWGERAPASATNLIQGYVAELRRTLGAEAILTRASGYVLPVVEEELDALQFARLTRDALALPPDGAAQALRTALALWRGPALSDVPLQGSARHEAERLNELRLEALAERIDADLACGRHHELVAELEALVAEHPLRERLRAQLMLALYRSGRQAEALLVYRKTRRALAGELGLEPSRELQTLEKAILTQDPALAAPAAPTKPSATRLPIPPTPLTAARRNWRRQSRCSANNGY